MRGNCSEIRLQLLTSLVGFASSKYSCARIQNLEEKLKFETQKPVPRPTTDDSQNPVTSPTTNCIQSPLPSGSTTRSHNLPSSPIVSHCPPLSPCPDNLPPDANSPSKEKYARRVNYCLYCQDGFKEIIISQISSAQFSSIIT